MKTRRDITTLFEHTRKFDQASCSRSGIRRSETAVQHNAAGLTPSEGLEQSSHAPAQEQRAEVSDFQPRNPAVRNDGDLGSQLFENEWLTTHEAAQYLRVPVGSLKNMTSNGQVPHYKLGRRNRYWLPDLRKLLLSEKRGS